MELRWLSVLLAYIGAVTAGRSSCPKVSASSESELRGGVKEDSLDEGVGCCKLTQSEPTKPFPSLTQCYKYNTNTGACCKSGHDQKIKSEYALLLSDTCLREFTYLEEYFCLGCNNYQYRFVSYPENETEKPVLRICNSFAEKLFDKLAKGATEDGTKHGDNYDTCALNMKVRNKNSAVGALWYPGNYEDAEERQWVMPFDVFENYTQFLQVLKPPYFEGYELEFVNPTDADMPDCFDAASSLQLLLAPLLVAMLAHLASALWF